MDPSTTAIGTWSGGRFMRFGQPLDAQRLVALLAPSGGVDTLITADVYGDGDGDRLLGRALAGHAREDYCLVGAIGHDFYSGERAGAKGYPRFTDPGLRSPTQFDDYVQMATERSLERCGVDRFDLLLLHNPDQIGYTSADVWDALRSARDSGLTRMLGVAPGPANGFTLDLIACLERFGEVIDWAMIILSPMEPWPGELALDAAVAHDVGVITRVVDYGGIFYDDVGVEDNFAEHDHRRFRPTGWVAAGRERLERMRPYAQRHELTPLQLACAWNLAQPGVRCVVPTIIQEQGTGARPVEDKRAELAAVAGRADIGGLLTPEELAAIRSIGDNTGCMALKGANPDHTGPSEPDRWRIDGALSAVAGRWGIDPELQLARAWARERAPL
jgi:aryl-alcohol dehydrogenase-like predicted oxidoreductase